MTQSNNKDTQCVHAGMAPEPVTGAVVPPVFQVTTYAQESPGHAKVYDYARAGNPTRTALEQALAALEGAAYAYTFASGLAAEQAVIQLLQPGDHVVVCDDVYGGTGRLFRRLFAKYGIEFSFVDLSAAKNDRELAAHFNAHTRLVWVESPTNPLLKCVDIALVSRVAQAHQALCLVDNTFASPIFQNPLALGAHLVLHSSTKYLGGHSDVIGGCVMTNDEAVAKELHFIQFAGGSVNGPWDAFLMHRSLKTLSLRMHKHQQNALALATALQYHPHVTQVLYPGLASHPQHALAMTQMSGFSGMISIRLPGSWEQVKTFFSHLKLWTLAESLGGVESLINHPETMTHASVPADKRAELGISWDLIRLSVGIEHVSDLAHDLHHALQSTYGPCEFKLP